MPIEGGCMDSQFKTGILRSWNATRGFGFVEVPSKTFPIQKYFLHVSMILDGPCPPDVGSIVRFAPAPPRKEGQLPTASKASIVVLPEKAPKAVL
jgi:cold shock CspA family protein